MSGKGEPVSCATSTVHVVGQEGSGADGCVIEECFHGILQVAGDRKIGKSRPISTQY